MIYLVNIPSTSIFNLALDCKNCDDFDFCREFKAMVKNDVLCPKLPISKNLIKNTLGELFKWK